MTNEQKFTNAEERNAAHNRVCRAVETAAKQSVTDCNHLGNAAKMREAPSPPRRGTAMYSQKTKLLEYWTIVRFPRKIR